MLTDTLSPFCDRFSLSFISFEPTTACAAKQAISGSRACWLIEYLPSGGFDEALRIARSLNLDGIHIAHDLAHEDRIASAQDIGLTVNVWTINTASEAHRFAALGVDGLTTDVPDVIVGAFSPSPREYVENIG